jgi:hypothetical protein
MKNINCTASYRNSKISIVSGVPLESRIRKLTETNIIEK